MAASSELSKPTFRSKKEYWSWFAWVTYLLISVDLLMTSLATDLYGIEGELNPIVTEIFNAGLGFIIVSHLVAVIFCSLCFLVVLECFDESSSIISDSSEYIRESPAFVLDVWIGVVFGIGIAIFANNLLVIVGRPSLIETGSYILQLLAL